MINEVLEYLPQELQNEISEYINQNNQNQIGNAIRNKIEKQIEEIRMRINQNLSIKNGQNIEILNHKITKKEIEETFENICEKSIYSYTKQISQGFITVKGGNRVGITGSCVIEENKVKNINNISSLNFRIARQIKDVSTPLLKDVIDIENNTIYNTMIVAPPGAGKTTILRDLVRKISNRNT